MELSTVKTMLTAAPDGKKAQTFEANSSDPKHDTVLTWRMVYNSKKIIALFQGTGRTLTRNNLFCAETKKECAAKAKELGLELPPDRRATAKAASLARRAARLKA